jgi:hypothetical protein
MSCSKTATGSPDEGVMVYINAKPSVFGQVLFWRYFSGTRMHASAYEQGL